MLVNNNLFLQEENYILLQNKTRLRKINTFQSNYILITPINQYIVRYNYGSVYKLTQRRLFNADKFISYLLYSRVKCNVSLVNFTIFYLISIRVKTFYFFTRFFVCKYGLIRVLFNVFPWIIRIQILSCSSRLILIKINI